MAYTFTVVNSNLAGFVRVSPTDSRFFEWSDGTPFLAPLVNVEDGSPFNGLAQITTVQKLGQNGARFVRWFPGGANHSIIPFGDNMRFSWMFGEARVTVNNPDTATGHPLLLRAVLLQPTRAAGRPRARYRLLVRARHLGQQGSADGSHRRRRGAGRLVACRACACTAPHEGWSDYTLEFANTASADGLLIAFRDGLDAEQRRRRRHPHLFRLAATLRPAAGDRDLLSRGGCGHHEYVDQVDAARLDELFRLSEDYGVYHKLTLFHKNDEILNRLVADGSLGAWNIDNFYSADGHASRWYQQAYARYFVARWSYSPALHSLELANENMLTPASSASTGSRWPSSSATSRPATSSCPTHFGAGS